LMMPLLIASAIIRMWRWMRGARFIELDLHCPNCRLTVYNPPTVLAPERCPRCGVRFQTQPQRLGPAAPRKTPSCEDRER
jgi:hypothetical protein